ncbi:MAG: Fe-S cluster assembly protein SufD [Bdellovibrionota bacterium]
MIAHYKDQFDQWINSTAQNSWYKSLRTQAFEAFEKNGFPTQKEEAWKHADLSLFRKEFFPALASKDSFQKNWKSDFEKHVDFQKIQYLAFWGGQLVDQSIDDQSALMIQNLDQLDPKTKIEAETILTSFAPRYDHPFYQLNTAFHAQAIWIHVKKTQSKPLILFYLDQQTSKVSAYYRNLVVAESQVSIQILEYFPHLESSQVAFNVTTQVSAKENALVEHVKIQDQNLTSYHQGFFYGLAQRNATIKSFSFSRGAAFARNDVDIVLDGIQSHGDMFGLYSNVDHQYVDHRTCMDHRVAHCTSKELYKGVLADQSHAVFEGRIKVHEGAQKTDSQQMNRNLLLSDEAKVDTAPQLEIFADDVKCAHGATIGKLDEEQLFYLQSRGIDRAQATQLLIGAFVGEVFDELSLSFQGLVRGIIGKGWEHD